ncbi:hypothetical protein B0H66DRAFT_638842 [Apodospora peruviana]|uniref:Uncharacterized protein n=1 Tax=Apodospora peruviana TaxID=516989 RepID=A0AAE0M7Q7_9PEZI|nr:hypothetical protein B0H66DRAFT_638842 [Apodospora peruviana]
MTRAPGFVNGWKPGMGYLLAIITTYVFLLLMLSLVQPFSGGHLKARQPEARHQEHARGR